MRQCSIRVSNILRFHHPVRSKTLQFLQVLIAPLFVPIFVLSRDGDDGNTRKKKKRKGKKRHGRKRRKKKNLFHNQLQPVHPRHFTREHFFATVSVTRCTFLLARVLAYLLSLSLSFFRVLPPLLHDAHCASSMAANESLSCQECNFCDDFSSQKK